MNSQQYAILTEIIRVANGRRFPSFDGIVEFDRPQDVAPRGKAHGASVTGRVLPEGGDAADEPVQFTILLT